MNPQMKPIRNTRIDFARGIAILIMLLANSAPYVLINEPIPFLIRFLFSTAAPLFIFLSGYSLNLSFQHNKTKSTIIQRALQVLFVAVFIDVFIWNIIPFETFDVLYLIGFSQLILITLHTSKSIVKFGVMFLILILFGFCLLCLNYTFQIIEHDFSISTLTQYSIQSALQRLFFDGWFPLIPWFCISLLGYLACSFNNDIKKFNHFFTLGFILLLVSYFLFILFPEWINNPRDKYLEIFYPITPFYGLLLLGLFSLLIGFINSTFEVKSIFVELGKLSLFIYLMHVIMINFIITKFTFVMINEYYTFLLIGIVFIFSIILLTKLISKMHPYFLQYKITKPILFLLGL